MLKNKYKHNQLFTTIIIISLFALPCLSFSNEKKLERLAQSLKNNYQLELSNQHLTQKSKQDIEPLFGAWVLLYNSGNITYTAKIVLETYRLSDDGRDLVYGRFYRDENSAERKLGCIKDKTDFDIGYDTNYFCMTSDKIAPYRIFSLQFTDNNIAKGILSIGDTFDEASNHIGSSNTHVSGFLSSGNFPLIQTNYYEDIDELHIPILNYKNSKYNVVLKHTENQVYTIQSVTDSSGISAGEVGLDSIYYDDTEEILIPMVKYKGSIYSVVLKNTGQFIFALKDVYPIKKVHSGQSDFYIDPYLIDPNINPITGGFVWDPVTLYPVTW
jgi:hypothetical protein